MPGERDAGDPENRVSEPGRTQQLVGRAQSNIHMMTTRPARRRPGQRSGATVSIEKRKPQPPTKKTALFGSELLKRTDAAF